MKQQVYLEERYSYKLPDGTSLFWLQDPIILPNPQQYRFTVAVPHASFPLTHYAITSNNNSLELVVDGVPQAVELPLGNHSIDEVVERLQGAFLGIEEVLYEQSTNELRVFWYSGMP